MSPRADSLLGYWIEAQSQIHTVTRGLGIGEPGFGSARAALPVPVAMPGTAVTAAAVPSIRAPHGIEHGLAARGERMPATISHLALPCTTRRD